MKFHVKLILAVLLTGALWTVGSNQSPGAYILLRLAKGGRILLIDEPYQSQFVVGALHGLALALPLWWTGRSMRWHHALAVAVAGYLTSTYRLTMPLWAIGLVQPSTIFGQPGLLLAPPTTPYGGYAFVPIIRPFLAGLLVGLVLQRTSRAVRWKHTLVIAVGWTLISAVSQELFNWIYPLLFADGTLLRSMHYVRWSLLEGLLISLLLYGLLVRNGWGRDADEARSGVVDGGLVELARGNLFTGLLTRGQYRITLWGMTALLVVSVFLGRAFVTRRPTSVVMLFSMVVLLLPPLLIAVLTANVTLAQVRRTLWDQVRLTNLTEREMSYACFQAGLYQARWALVVLVLLTALLSYGVMRVYTGLFLSLAPMTLPNPLKWKLSLASLPLFLSGLVVLGAAVGTKVALRMRTWGAMLLAPATMLAVVLGTLILAQNYQQGILSLVSEAILFATLPWLLQSELMRSEL